MSITTQYMDATRKVQDNWFAAYDAMTSQALRQLERPVATPFAQVDVASAVDEFFDFANKALAVQRETAHKVLAANNEMAQQFFAQAEQFQGVIRDQAKSLTEATREQAEQISATTRDQVQTFGETVEKQVEQAKAATEEGVDAATEQAKRNYNLMNSAQLKAELSARKLAQTGSLEEMRTRLKDADKDA